MTNEKTKECLERERRQWERDGEEICPDDCPLCRQFEDYQEERKFAVYQPTEAALEREKYADFTEDMRFYDDDYELVGYVTEENLFKYRGNLYPKGVVELLPRKVLIGHLRLASEKDAVVKR